MSDRGGLSRVHQIIPLIGLERNIMNNSTIYSLFDTQEEAETFIKISEGLEEYYTSLFGEDK